MKKVIFFVIILFIPLFLGMGNRNSPDKIPKPAKNFNVTYIDQSDVTTTCTEVSIDGMTFISGKRGEGTYMVSFENIKSIIFLKNEGALKAVVKLTDGGTVEIILNKEQKAFGRTKYGVYTIKLNDLKKIIFQ